MCVAIRMHINFQAVGYAYKLADLEAFNGYTWIILKACECVCALNSQVHMLATLAFVQ